MGDTTKLWAVNAEAELDRLAERHNAAGGTALKILAAFGGQAEGLLDRLPKPVRDGLEDGTERALRLALEAARRSRKGVPDQPAWINTAMTTAMGAVGGFGGLPGALMELPASTTVLMRAIQGAAARNGFDPEEETVRFDCIRVFASAGPLEKDDGTNTAFLSLRLAMTGAAVQKMIATVAPKLSVVLGQKLAAQAVPVLGAVSGATVNYLYTRYYQEMAEVHFGLRRLAIEADLPEAELIEKLSQRLGSPAPKTPVS